MHITYVTTSMNMQSTFQETAAYLHAYAGLLPSQLTYHLRFVALETGVKPTQATAFFLRGNSLLLLEVHREWDTRLIVWLVKPHMTHWN